MDRSDFNKDTFSFSIAMFNCVVNAVLVFFFPIATDSPIWVKIIVCILLMLSMPALHYKDELKKQRQNNPDLPHTKRLAYYVFIFSEIVGFAMMMVLLLAPVLTKNSIEGKMNSNWNDPEAWQKLGDTSIYILQALIPFSSTFLFLLAGAQGKRINISYIYTIAVLILIAVAYYLEMRENGVQLPKYIQPILFLLNIPYLFRLRQLESYSHLAS